MRIARQSEDGASEGAALSCWLQVDGAAESIPVLRDDEQGLVLVGDGMELRGDFAHMRSRLKPGKLQRELLVRAARVKDAGDCPFAVDATAGLGEDALLLAAAGFRVRLYERDPIVAALLRDALQRAACVPDLADAVARMSLHEGDSIEELSRLDEAPDVVLLDPMFPVRTKSASTKKKFQLLHKLEHPCDDEEALLGAAVAAHPRKVVVKRPPKGPHLAGVEPAYSLAGKAIRYDVYVFAR